MGRLVSLMEAERLCQKLRRQGKRVVLTNGAFDLLHVGHVRCLQAARSLGDALFVGLNSDQSVRDFKGPNRPIMAQAERAEVLCALACTDYVVLFEEPTAEHLVDVLRPDVYAKGGDYATQVAGNAAKSDLGKALPEARAVESYGGRVVILPFTPGHSTSQIIATILKTCPSDKRG